MLTFSCDSWADKHTLKNRQIMAVVGTFSVLKSIFYALKIPVVQYSDAKDIKYNIVISDKLIFQINKPLA